VPYSRSYVSRTVCDGSFPFFPHRREPAPEPIRGRGTQDETAALDADNEVDLLPGKRGRHGVDGGFEALLIPQQGGDIEEGDPCFGEVRHRSNFFFE